VRWRSALWSYKRVLGAEVVRAATVYATSVQESLLTE
jgi:hypothetical protein